MSLNNDRIFIFMKTNALKKWFTKNRKFCHYLLTLLTFKTCICMTFFLLQNAEYFFPNNESQWSPKQHG